MLSASSAHAGRQSKSLASGRGRRPLTLFVAAWRWIRRHTELAHSDTRCDARACRNLRIDLPTPSAHLPERLRGERANDDSYAQTRASLPLQAALRDGKPDFAAGPKLARSL